jgi:hypothetical protein
MRPFVVLTAALALALALAGCGSSGWRTWHGRGVSVRIPPGWHATSTHLSPVTWPVQFLAVASYPLPRSAAGSDGCEPAGVGRLPADGAFIYGWEYVGDAEGPPRKTDFPRRPRRFRLGRLGRYECLDHSYLLRFREAGRFFQVHVLLGRHATPRTRALVLRVLDGLRVKRR